MIFHRRQRLQPWILRGTEGRGGGHLRQRVRRRFRLVERADFQQERRGSAVLRRAGRVSWFAQEPDRARD